MIILISNIVFSVEVSLTSNSPRLHVIRKPTRLVGLREIKRGKGIYGESIRFNVTQGELKVKEVRNVN